MHFEQLIAILAALFLVFSQVQYIVSTIKKNVRPSLPSWLGWAVLTGTSLLSQYLVMGWQWNFTGILVSTVSCLVVASVAIGLKNYSIRKDDWIYVILGCICIGIYLASEDPWITTIYAIFADFILGIPTLRKAFYDPKSEKSPAWLLGLLSWTFSLILCLNQNLLSILFPVYLFLFNVAMVYLTMRK